MTISPASGSDLAGARSQAYDRLDPRLRRWIHDRGWTSLHDAQEMAVAPILAGDRDVIIAAATAAGKTEAAFLPICFAIAPSHPGAPAVTPDPWTAHDPWAEASPERSGAAGVQVLCVSPLKALINDQHDRLEQICERVDVPVHRWHGDVAASAKQRLLRAPSGVLLITPESLEALFVNRGADVPALLGGLRYVVVDELHAFLGSARGAQLQSLLHRVELAIRRRPPRIGLSATLGDETLAAEFLRPRHAAQVHTITSKVDGQELRLQVRGHRTTAPSPPAVSEVEDEDEDEGIGGDRLAIGDHLFATLRGQDNLVFANRRRDVEIYADLLRRRSEAERLPNEFWPHHGNLAKDVREDVERLLKDRTRPTTAICTSTLEMGIDIGSMASVAQLGPPPSVAALRQRLGRSGRRDEAAVIRIYVTEAELDARSSPVDELRPDLVQTVAMVRLLVRPWVEAPADPGLDLSTLVQQVLSLIAQHGGVTAVQACRALCDSGPFRRVDQARFAWLLRAMASADLVVQAHDGTLLHGEVGERFVNHYSFYTAFPTAEEWRLVGADGGRALGSMPLSRPVSPGDRLIFAGRRWRIVTIDPSARILELTPSPGGVAPDFGGGAAEIADEVRREMTAVYREADEIGWLDDQGRSLLREARSAWRRLDLDRVAVLPRGDATIVLPWIGDRALVTMAVALRRAGVEADVEGPVLHVTHGSAVDVVAAAQALTSAEPPAGAELARGLQNIRPGKWDWVLDDELAFEAAGEGQLDVPGAWRAFRRLVEIESGRTWSRTSAGDTALPSPQPALVPGPAPSRVTATPVAAPRAVPARGRSGGLEFCVVDVETTGFSPRLGDRVLEVATVRMQADGTVTDEWTTLVNPRRDVGARHVHGISATDLAGAPGFDEIAGDLLHRLDRAVVVAHNLRFDWQFLDAEYGRVGHALPPFPRLCTLGLASRLGPPGASRKLATCCAAFGIPLPRAHEALDDARAAAGLLGAYMGLARRRGLATLADLGCEPLAWPPSLPDVVPSGRCHHRGDRRHLDDQAHYLARLVARLDGTGTADPQQAAYADLLDRVLEDRRLTDRESDALFATAAGWQLDAATVAEAHRSYLDELASAALEDGVVTDAEHADLVLVAQLLGMPASDVDAALERVARPTGHRTAPVARVDPIGPVDDGRGRIAAGSSVCFTGTLTATIGGDPITRTLAEELATKAGLVVAKNVSKKLAVLVVADPDTLSGKAERARQLGTRILAEQVFWRAIDVAVD